MSQATTKDSRKTRVAVLFGGRSTEHEISIVTALQVLDAFDSTRFETLPVYIDQEGYWFEGEELRRRENYFPTPELKQKLCRVRLTGDLLPELVEAEPKKGWFGRKEPRRFPVDVFFPAFHGSYGEDGCIQGFLEFIGAAYTGSGPRASAVGMNKHASKQIASALGISILPDVMLNRKEWDPEKADALASKVVELLPLPLMVKPCNLGSSIGISSAHTLEELMISLAGAFAFDHQVMVEPLLEEMYELNISAMDGNPVRLSAIERPRREDKLLTFEDKYLKGNKKLSSSHSGGMASMQRDIDPPDVPDGIREFVRSYASKVFTGMDCRGLVRIDFLIDQPLEKVYFNEINLLPGSFAYFLWEKAEPRISFTELLADLVHQAQEEWQIKKSVRRTIERRIFVE